MEGEGEEGNGADVEDVGEAKDSGDIGLEGAVQALSSTGVTVDGKTVQLTSSTKVEGTLPIGITVEVEVVMRNGSLIATQIKVNCNAATPPAPATIPAAPAGLAATAAGATRVNLSWADNSSNETGFYIQRATDSGFTMNLASFTVRANVTTYSDATVAASTTYYYRVLAYNSAGDSAAATASATTPSETPTIDATLLYANNCAVCHGATRLGGVGPALTPTSFASRTVTRIASFIAGHRSGFTTAEYSVLADWLKNTAP